jgi:4-amino-4-deoxy-L-arabinose transferase-like glycosyltransferase
VNALPTLARWARRWSPATVGGPPPRAKDAGYVFAVALAVRAVVAVLGASRFPPVDDGTFYQVVAARIAAGHGYTWAWPDGAVTHAAHYPVGYPALLGVFYFLFGAGPGVAMAVNAGLGALAAPAAHALAGTVGSRRGAVVAGLLVALEPALVAYTPALMTEAVAGELLLLAAAVAVSARLGAFRTRVVLASVLLGVCLLVRPQLALLAPVIGVLAAAGDAKRRLAGAVLVTAVSVGLCLPWTMRNCARLDRCAFVSANGGWNLYIGSSPLGRGGFAPLDAIGVPEECRTVFGEGGKDRCFGGAGLRRIAEAPGAWLSLVPRKLGMTFDYGTAAAHYLSASNGAVVGEKEKAVLGAAELFGQRILLLCALFALARAPGPRARPRAVVTLLSAFVALTPAAWPAWLGVAGSGLLLGRSLFRHPPAFFAVFVVLATALTHAVFFGASRYALVCLPALAALGGAAFLRAAPEDT